MIPLIEKGVAAAGLRPGMRFGQRYILADSTISEDDIRDMK